MRRWKTLLTVCVVVGGAVLFAACDSREQGRPLNYKKGVYMGKPHQRLQEGTLRELRERANYQAGLTTTSGGGGAEIDAPSTASDVRPPASAGINAEALRERASNQGRK